MIVVGSVNIDLVVTAPRLPAAGETVAGGTFARHHGGKGGNQAVAAARLGAQTAFVGAVGDDEFGTDARRALEAEGVDATELRTAAGDATGVALIVVAFGGENLIAVASGANHSLTPDGVRASLSSLALRAGDVVLVGHEIPTASAREALRLGRQWGTITVLDPAPADGLDRSVFGLADVLTPNRAELARLLEAEARRTGRPEAPAPGLASLADSLVKTSAEGAGVPAVFVSLGAGGALLVRPGTTPVDIAAPPVHAVDTTGAGDALNGALAAGLASGLDLEGAARRAVVAASISTTASGARDGLPTARELEAASNVAPS